MFRALRRTAVLIATAFAVLVGVSPTASADPYWEPVVVTGDFHCSAINPHPFVYAYMRTCVVVNGTATQSVAVVVNHGSQAVTIEAPHVQLWVGGSLSYDRNCLSSTLSANTTRACFGPTQQRACGTWVRAEATVTITGRTFSPSSPSRQMCTV